jgi:hypothetical protein
MPLQIWKCDLATISHQLIPRYHPRVQGNTTYWPCPRFVMGSPPEADPTIRSLRTVLPVRHEGTLAHVRGLRTAQAHHRASPRDLPGRDNRPRPGQPLNLPIFDKVELRQRSFFNEDGITHNFSQVVVGDTTPCQPSLLRAGGNRLPGPRQLRIPISQPI